MWFGDTLDYVRSHSIKPTLTILKQTIYCVSHSTPQPQLECKMISSVVVWALVCTWAKVFFRSLTCRCQTTDSSNSSVFFRLYFVVCNECASGKCIGVKVYIFIRKCSGVKVKVDRNIKTQVKYRYSQEILKYCNKVLLLCYITPLCNSIAILQLLIQNDICL